MQPLLVLGSVNADLYVEIPRLPLPGETIPGHGAAVRPGGKGANQAAAAARLGRPTWFAGRVGRDAYAPPLLDALTRAGVDAALVEVVEGPTGQALILLQDGGENSIILVAGANHVWGFSDGVALAPAIAGAIPHAGALLLQREIPEAVDLAAARIARSAGVPVLLDAGGGEGPLPPELLVGLHTLSPNETELAAITGLPTASDEQVLVAARSLQRHGVSDVLVKLGARGSLLVERSGAVHRQGAFPVAVVDTTGAGDCFTAAYTVALLDGLAPAARLRFASAAAAICVQGKGAMPSMPDSAAVDALLRA